MKKTYLTHGDIDDAVADMAKDISDSFGSSTSINVYPIPRGGIPPAYLLARHLRGIRIVDDPDFADIFVDDVVDSGATRQRYQRIDIPFFTLYDKTTNPDLGWLVFPWEIDAQGNDSDSISDSVTRQLQYIGEDVNRDGLLDTPKRVVKSYDELFAGYKQDPIGVFTTFESGTYDQMVLLKDIEFYSTCEHHLLPFFGKAHVAYIPSDKVIGISKLARLFEIFSRRLQIQERIGEQVTTSLLTHLDPKGAACIIEGQHLCMQARGIQKQHSVMITSSLKGVFLENLAAREELMRLIGSR